MTHVIPVILVVFAGGLTFWVASLSSRHRESRHEARRVMLGALSSRDGIDLTWDESALSFNGSSGRWAVGYEFIVLGNVEGIAVFGTTASLRVPLRTLNLEARPVGMLSSVFDRRALAVPTGDDEFDRAFHVERPKELAGEILDERVKHLLEQETRMWLMALRPARLRVSEEGLVFEKTGRLDDESSIRVILTGLARIADRLSEPLGYRQ